MQKLLLRPGNFFMKNLRLFFCTLLLCVNIAVCFAQTTVDPGMKKSAKYENRQLKSEKTGEKKFTLPKRVMQNTVTHYNYYFNANNRLNEVINQAKLSFKDDYSSLLPFYNYTLEATAQNKTELDSIIYKCTAGILLHDLRNDWVDNMYLLLGKTYLLRNDLDSAGMTFQYLNFTFAPKEEGGYDIPIGSNSSNETGEFSIATNEKKRNIYTKITGHKPSRNESFIWQIRNNIEKNELPEAAGIIEILRHDPNFPSRLKTDLNEVVSYWFYKQQVYDSSAYYLSKALNEADNKQEQSRWEYLIGQLYQLSNKNKEAIEYYNRSIHHTNNPVMDVYARLNAIRINGGDDKNFVQKNIDELVKMAKKDKYENYRDIIYYAAATIELERNNPDAAQSFLLKSAKYSVNNPFQKSKSFMLLGDLNYDRKMYSASYNFYDSANVNSLSVADKERLQLRKPSLKIIADNDFVIVTEDSLQALAKLPADQREAILRKRAKQLRKAQGLKEEEPGLSMNPAVQTIATSLFADEKSGDFYFYNASMKSSGFSEFKSRWGQRPNVDNWRRQSAVNSIQTANTPVIDNAQLNSNLTDAKTVDANSYEGLTNNIPLTEEKLAVSNNKIMEGLYTEGKTFLEKIEDLPTAISTFEELLRRFPNTKYKEEVLFDLSYAYEKTGDKAKADQYKNQLVSAAPESKWAKTIKNPNPEKAGSGNNAATKKYEDIYNLFIEGRFDEAKTEKKAADSIYGKSYWTPQLLFIEAIYYVKQKEDSTAIRSLNNLVTLYANNPMAARAKTMIDVLGRRKQIEDYLTKLDVTRNTDSTIVSSPSQPAVVYTNPNPPKKDTVTAVGITPPTTPAIKKETPVIRKDTVAKAPVIVRKNFTFVPADPHYVVLLLDKVDPVYASEAKNAFNRYNKEKYYNQNIDMASLQLDDRFHLVLQGPFPDANAAVSYIDKTQPVTKSRILPWLTPDKYSFIVISAANLDVLKSNKDMTAYKQLLQQAFPGKF